MSLSSVIVPLLVVVLVKVVGYRSVSFRAPQTPRSSIKSISFENQIIFSLKFAHAFSPR